MVHEVGVQDDQRILLELWRAGVRVASSWYRIPAVPAGISLADYVGYDLRNEAGNPILRPEATAADHTWRIDTRADSVPSTAPATFPGFGERMDRHGRYGASSCEPSRVGLGIAVPTHIPKARLPPQALAAAAQP